MKLILICTPTYNKPGFLRVMLQSLRETADGGLYRHLVVDNGSSPETARVCRKFGVECLFPGRNLGVAGALNLALAELKRGQHLMKLDDDLLFSEPGWLTQMLRVLAIPSVGGVALMRAGREEEQSDGESVVVENQRLILAGRKWWSNCALYRHQAVKTLGSFWQPGLYGYEDMFTGVRLRCLGWQTVYLTGFTVEHRGSWRFGREAADYRLWKARERAKVRSEVERLYNEFISGARPAFLPLGVCHDQTGVN